MGICHDTFESKLVCGFCHKQSCECWEVTGDKFYCTCSPNNIMSKYSINIEGGKIFKFFNCPMKCGSVLLKYYHNECIFIPLHYIVTHKTCLCNNGFTNKVVSQTFYDCKTCKGTGGIKHDNEWINMCMTCTGHGRLCKETKIKEKCKYCHIMTCKEASRYHRTNYEL